MHRYMHVAQMSQEGIVWVRQAMEADLMCGKDHCLTANFNHVALVNGEEPHSNKNSFVRVVREIKGSIS